MLPDKISRYEIKSELGRGGMATVYLAHDPSIHRDVAIKVLPREFLHDPNFIERFKREARTIASLEHPSIVPVYDFGEEEGQPFIIMRMMGGDSLSNRLKAGGALPLDESARILEQLAGALDDAHKKGIIHRDIKPGNILFDHSGNAYLSDFGIVKISEATAKLTGTGLVGTPAYMSPEQAKGEGEIDSRSDIYGLGVVLFQMLTGELPYEADTPMGVAVKHILEPVPSILSFKDDLPDAIDDVILRAMAKDPEERYSTAKEMSAVFTKAVASVSDEPAKERTQKADATTAMPKVVVEENDLTTPMPKPVLPGEESAPEAEPTVRGTLKEDDLQAKDSPGCMYKVAAIACAAGGFGWVVVSLMLMFVGGQVGIGLCTGGLFFLGMLAAFTLWKGTKWVGVAFFVLSVMNTIIVWLAG